MLTLLVGVAAAVGALGRYLTDRGVRALAGTRFPWGTHTVNVAGSFVLGLVTGLAARNQVGGHLATVVGVGLCGGYTTWSTYSWESVALAEDGRAAAATVNALAGLAGSLLAAAAGLGAAILAT